MRQFAVATGLTYGVDVAPAPGMVPQSQWDVMPVNASLSNATVCVPSNCGLTLSEECLPCVWVRDNATLTSWMLTYPNSSQNVIHFPGAYLGGTDASAIVYYNLSSTLYPFYANPHSNEVLWGLQVALMQLGLQGAGRGNTSVRLDVAQRGFPSPPPRLAGYDVVSSNGGQWFFLVPCVTFFVLLTDLVAEKEQGLRVGMAQMGLRRTAYWCAWATHAVVYAVVTTLVLQASAWALRFEVFTNTAWPISFLVFFSFSVSMSCLAALVSTLVGSSKTAQTAGYSLILIGFVFQFVVGAGQGALADLLYSTGLAPWVVGVRWVLERYPAFLFSLLFADMALLAGSTVSQAEGRVVTGPGFHWSDVFVARTRQVADFDCTLLPPIELLALSCANAAAFALLALYLDAVVPGAHGPASHPLCCLGLRYSARSVGTAGAGAHSDHDDAGVAEEAAFAAAPAPVTGDDPAVVRVSSLRVVYRSLCSRWCGVGRGSDVEAVRGLSLTLRRGEVLALLGHNGCGKSSTIAVLTGLHEAAGGQASVCGVDATDVDAVQALVGVCPQQNLQYAALTALETLQLYCAVKGLPPSERHAEVQRVLRQVRLAPVAATVRVGKYSGGMKRRLAVAVAALGRPPVVVLDEPTTGMDPLSRQACWRLIHSLKRDASILLTTHDMAEANALGSRVAIMAAGRLCALGTPLRLKRQYGQGCRLSVVLRSRGALSRVRNDLLARLPGTRLSLLDGNNAVFTVPWADVASGMPSTCDWLDSLCAPKGETTVGAGGGAEVAATTASAETLVSTYSVSAPTLEAVFLTVTASHDFQVLTADDGAIAARERPPRGRRKRRCRSHLRRAPWTRHCCRLRGRWRRPRDRCKWVERMDIRRAARRHSPASPLRRPCTARCA